MVDVLKSPYLCQKGTIDKYQIVSPFIKERVIQEAIGHTFSPAEEGRSSVSSEEGVNPAFSCHDE